MLRKSIDQWNMEEIKDDTSKSTVFENDFSSDEDDIVWVENQNVEWSLETDGLIETRSWCKRLKKQSSTFDDIHSFIDEDVLKNDIQEAGIIQGLNKYINDSIADWEFKSINVAITGGSGSGKSSLINALRGLSPKYPGAAKVGIKETTTTVEKYKFPESDKVTLWDLPGIGTQNFTRESYLNDFALSKFDIVVVVTASRFFENDLWIAKQAKEMERSVIFVRTKIDMDLMNASRDDPDNFDEMKCMITMKKDIEENVQNIGVERIDDVIFLVSSPDRLMYDLPKLCKKLKSLVNTKGESICKFLLEYLQKATEEKREEVRKRFTCKRVASAVIGAIPIPKIETTFGTLTLREIREISLKLFSLDDKSLETVSKELNMSVEELKGFELKSFNTEQISDVEKLFTEIEENRYSTFRKYAKYLVPIAGSVLSACKASSVTQDCQNVISGIMADDEFRLVQLRLRRLERQLRLL